MAPRNKDEQQNPIDKNLDTPGEANTQKHMNFLDEEVKTSKSSGNTGNLSNEGQQQKNEWEESLDAANREREEEQSFEK